MRRMQERWTARIQTITARCALCGADLDIISTGNPYLRGQVMVRCINDGCQNSNRYSAVTTNGGKNGTEKNGWVDE